MKPDTLPANLSQEAQKVAQRTGLSLDETIEESRRLGFSRLRETIPPDPRTHLKPYNIFVASHATGLSVEEVAWRCVELGLPILAEQLCVEPLADLQPLSREDSRRCFAVPNPDFDAAAAHCASLPVPIPKYESLGHF